MSIRKCESIACQERGSAYQDEKYGKGMRVHTHSRKAKQEVCTVCGTGASKRTKVVYGLAKGRSSATKVAVRSVKADKGGGEPETIVITRVDSIVRVYRRVAGTCVLKSEQDYGTCNKAKRAMSIVG